MHGLQAVCFITSFLDEFLQGGAGLHYIISANHGLFIFFYIHRFYLIKSSHLTIHIYIPQISYKLLRIVADAAPELVEDLKHFFVNLFLFSSEYVTKKLRFFFGEQNGDVIFMIYFYL